jgi:hypothetical protein
MFGTHNNCGGCHGGQGLAGKGNNCCCLLLLLLLCGCNGFGEDNCCWNIILLLIILNSCGCGNGFGC